MAQELQYTADGLPYYQDTLPVDVSNLQDYAATLPSPAPNPLPTHNPYVQTSGEKVASILTGGNGQERYQLFPERIVRSALSLPTDVMSGKVRTPSNPPATGSEEDYSSDELLQRVQDMAALMGGGGFGMAEKGALGSVGGKVVQPIADVAKAEVASTIASVFHSAVENAVNTASLKSAPPQQWLSTISNAKGVKPEELDWTGLKDWLGEQQGPVSKEQIQQHLEQNKVELKEVVKQDAPDIPQNLRSVDWFRPVVKNIETEADIAAARKYNSNFKETFKNQTDAEVLNDINEYKKIPYVEADPTKYSKYQLPGGENYREKLLTLPSVKDSAEYKALKAEADTLVGNNDPASRARQDEIYKRYDSLAGQNYKSSHWDEPNILAHIRMNDRTIEGKKALHIEEIQSDWHQQGREQGYKITDAQKKQLEQIDNKLTTKLSEADIGNPDMDAVLKTAIDKKVITSQEAANYKQWSKGENSNIPDAPFKKTWLDLAAKRMIREAAEQGKDVLSWTPGEAQAARYDLSKHIKRVELTDNSSGGIGRPEMEGPFQGGMLHAYDHNGREVIGKYINNENELAEHVGKEAAEKLMNVKPTEERSSGFGVRSRKLVDQDLKIGGEGMHYFYDKMLPATLERLTGQKMKVGSLKPKEDWPGQLKGTTLDQKINYIDLPQSVKNTALHKGFPLFSSGLMLSPTDDNPFKRYKLTPVDHDPFKEKSK